MSAAADPVVRHSVHKRRVNELIHESLHAHLDSQPIAFFCECTGARCFETVWLSAAEYEAGRLGARWFVRAPGH
jgi:redox-regulated HSP33 family molecular chaperone